MEIETNVISNCHPVKLNVCEQIDVFLIHFTMLLSADFNFGSILQI